MSIRTKLLLSALSEILLIIIFSIFLIVSSRQISNITATEAKATAIVKTVTEIRFVTFENLLHHDQRSYNQWQSKHSELADELASYPASDPQEKSVLASINQQHKDIGPLFNKLYASYATGGTSQKVIVQNQYQERQASQ